MRLIDEDHITQAVIACHAGAADPRLRDVMTSLVQHLHAFAREVKLTEAEWRAGLRFLAEAGRAAGQAGPAGAGLVSDHGPDHGPDDEPDGGPGRGPAPERELASLSEVLGLTMLVAALNQHRPPAGAGARAALHASFAAPASVPSAGPVATLLRALGRES